MANCLQNFYVHSHSLAQRNFVFHGAADSSLVKKLIINDCSVLSPKRDISIKSQPFSSPHQGSENIQEGDVDCKSRKMARKAVKCCLVDMTRLLHS